MWFIHCSLCRCYSVAVKFGFPVCAYHNAHGENDPPCPKCKGKKK